MQVSVENPGDFRRENETIEVSRELLMKKLGDFDGDHLLVEDATSGRVLTSQLNETELLFQSSFAPLERKVFAVRVTTEKVAKVQSMVDGRFELPREDYAWENDRIAFRMYGPALAAEVNNGIDVWTKRVRYLIVDKWYSASEAAGKDTYHEDHGEGADFFSVGRSLGAGGSGVWQNGKLYQPGVFTSQRTICNGPIRVTFELTYSNWNVEGARYTERKRISLDAEESLNRIEVIFDGGAGDPLQLACGLVKRPNTKMSADSADGVLSLWGLTNADSANGFLGTGVVIPPSSFLQFAEDKDHYLIIGQARLREPFVYYAGAGWTRSRDFKTESDWAAYLHNFALRVRAPLRVAPED